MTIDQCTDQYRDQNDQMLGSEVCSSKSACPVASCVFLLSTEVRGHGLGPPQSSLNPTGDLACWPLKHLVAKNCGHIDHLVCGSHALQL